MSVDGRPAQLLLSALRVSAVTAAWTLAASVSAIVIGLTGRSLALVAFGVVGVLDCAGSVVLVAHFMSARSGGRADHLEQLALHVISIGLVAVGVATGVVSALHLLDRDAASGSLQNVVIAAVSLVVLSLLCLRKRYVALRLPSRALLADSNLTAVGAILAAVTLFGTAASRSLGWWWADPVAALVIGSGAIGLGLALRRDR